MDNHGDQNNWNNKTRLASQHIYVGQKQDRVDSLEDNQNWVVPVNIGLSLDA